MPKSSVATCVIAPALIVVFGLLGGLERAEAQDKNLLPAHHPKKDLPGANGMLDNPDVYEVKVCNDKKEHFLSNMFLANVGTAGQIFKKTPLVTSELVKHEKTTIAAQTTARNNILKAANSGRPAAKVEKLIKPRPVPAQNLDVVYSKDGFVKIDVPKTSLFDPGNEGQRNGDSQQDSPRNDQLTVTAGDKPTPPNEPIVVTLTLFDPGSKPKVKIAEVKIEVTIIDCSEPKTKTTTRKKVRHIKKMGTPVDPNPPIGFEPKQDAFSGGFIGFQFAYSLSRTRTEEFFAANGIRTNSFDDGGAGAGGGIHGGYNWVMANRWLIGVVVEANALADRVRHAFPGGTYLASTMNFSASTQVRAGVLAAPNVLFYTQAGPAIANQKKEINFGGPVTEQSKLTGGVAVGGGAEVALPTGTLRSSLFVDYQHSWWSEAGVNTPAASPLFNYLWKRNSDTVRAGFRLGL